MSLQSMNKNSSMSTNNDSKGFVKFGDSSLNLESVLNPSGMGNANFSLNIADSEALR